MPLLIDGHNLIGKLPDIQLSDPDKEARLVARLQRYCARRGKTGTVIFDRGLPGGRSQWSNRHLKVLFASGNTNADAMLIRRIRRESNPGGLIVVSSDREIQQVARQCGAQVRSAGKFAEALSEVTAVQDSNSEQELSADEVDEWLKLFEKRDGEGES